MYLTGTYMHDYISAGSPIHRRSTLTTNDQALTSRRH
jgi:hypothetical protein